jgi:hypothetical protein
MALLEDLQKVGKALLDAFGAKGKFKQVDQGNFDPITGEEITPATEIEVQYYKDESYGWDRVTNSKTTDDSKIVFYFFENEPLKPIKSWDFIDVEGRKWNVKDIIQIEVEGGIVVYEAILEKR